jgi:hypothetical protein
MFRRLPGCLPAAPIFPKDLKSLEFYVNANGQLRSTRDPEVGFIYKITNNDKYKDMHTDAVYCRLRRVGVMLRCRLYANLVRV